MSYYAKVINNVVKRVIVAEQSVIDSGLFGDPDIWIETFKDGSKRVNFASVGYTYDAERDAFILPRPFPSWTLNETTCQWTSPTPYPTDGKIYRWDESTLTWIEVPTA